MAAAAVAICDCLVCPQTPAFSQSALHEEITVDAHGASTPFPHVWEEMFGSGHANLVMRADYQSDLRLVKGVTDFRFVRFHGIFDDENGVYSEDAQGRPVYNWSYVDHIYDALLANGVRPFVEISFMPKQLAVRPDLVGFWYLPIVSPPADYAKWDALVTAFARHLVDRYGIDEVAKWYFEVWNEPNGGFWTGRPAEKTYFELYDHTARALKAVNPRLRVGGPSTAEAAWVGDTIAHAVHDDVPLDFVSTHVYSNDPVAAVFPDHQTVTPREMVCAAVDKVHEEILHSARPHIPLIWSEYGPGDNHQSHTDSIYMGPWFAETISKCASETTMMSYWTFSDVFEEGGVIKTPFYGGFGLVAEDGIPKPSYDALKLLHELGDERLPAPVNEALVTRRADGTLVIAAWNFVEPDTAGSNKTITFELKGVPDGAHAAIRRVDAEHGDTLAAWKAMGSPKYPSRQQVEALRRAAEIGPPQNVPVRDHQLTIVLPPMGLAVAEIH
ncbi:MAG: glycosyl hydrolase family 39 [Candidatus Sulfotelmatobacter sp.]